jgi:hypothetical protein
MKHEDIHVGDKLWAYDGADAPIEVLVIGGPIDNWWRTCGPGQPCQVPGFHESSLYEDERSALADYRLELECELKYTNERLAQLEAERCPNN